ncbi:MAG TPA: right-handed parallel beta-helix repeat-containing protein [Polyangiaceae bacterium]|nr:right-handed parallel beta-helix repeat-containing protein [Polyangiaceae bacterium]
MLHRQSLLARARTGALFSLTALGLVSCADILGFEHGTRPDDRDASSGGTGGSGGAMLDGASDARADVATDGPGNPDSARGGAAGGDASTGGSGGSTTGGTPDGGNRGGTGGASGSGGTGGNSGTGGTGGSSGTGGSGGTGLPDASGGTGGLGPMDASPDRGPTCGAGQKICSNVCVSTSDPATGCAGTGCAPCAFPNATTTCDPSGQCALGTCTTGFDNCNTDAKDGCEADLSKADTCGSCAKKCDATAPLCSGSAGSYQCVTGCTPPTSTLCGAQCVDTDTNASHCGGCTMPCPAKANGDQVCIARMCDFTCHNGYHKCTATQTCASDTDINACGDTCKKCNVPANGKVACTAGDCVTTCNANYHVCSVNSVDTCLPDDVLASCGTRCAPCEPPTDPNAEAECVNKQCGSRCKSGFNLCGGVCSDTNSLTTCGLGCAMCVKPANASTVTCNGTSCVFTCNPGYEPSGMQCVVATNLYVSTAGSDTNPGTQALPFRTWKRAAQLAQSGTIVNFAPGTYDGAGGDDFTDPIPNGVTLQRSGSGTVTFTADGQHSLVFAGSGTVQNVTLTGFRSPFSATTGVQTIKGVSVTLQFDPIRVSGTAVMVISDSSTISGSTTDNQYLISVNSSGQLTLRDTAITGRWPSCFGPPVAGGGIWTTDSATLSLVNVTCSGILAGCVVASGSARVALTSSSLVNGCERGLLTAGNSNVTSSNTTFSDMEAREASSWTISGCSVGDTGFGTNLNGTGRASFRGCRFGGINGTRIGGVGTYDFGTSGSPGNNTFNVGAHDYGGLNVDVDGVTVQAHENQWVPLEQGADANGKMPSLYLLGPVGGKNVTIGSDQSAVDM